MTDFKQKPKVSSSAAEKEVDRLEKQFDDFDKEVKEMTHDRMSAAPKEEKDSQTKMSTRQMQGIKDIYLKPSKTISCRDKFNENYREQYNFSKEYVAFIAEHNEVKGDMIEIWTKRFAGQPAEFWEVPTNVPVWGPRYLAEQIRGCTYHRLSMDKSAPSNMSHGSSDHAGTYWGKIVADTTVQRLDARPVSQKKSVFMSEGF
ncbi:MAG TPA: hypothetical protein VGF75_07040 [Candidatus Saccharimonadales bacterium]|jgi:hypothetical protein